MTQIQIKNSVIEELRIKMKEDPIFKYLHLRYDSEFVNKICENYLQRERDKELIISAVNDLIKRRIIRLSKGDCHELFPTQ